MGKIVSKVRIRRRIRRPPRTIQTPVEPFRILDLPPELVSSICSHLVDEELLSIRYVCRAVNESSMPILGPRLFSHLMVILHPVSLAALLDIAKHPHFSEYVTQVTVCGDRLGYEILDLGAKFEDEDGSHAEINNRDHRELHDSVDKSEFPAVLLRQAFRSLPSLGVIRIYSRGWYCDKEGALDEGIACGRTSLFKDRRMRQADEWVLRVPIFQITLPVIAEIDPKGLLTLKVGLEAQEDLALSRDEHMSFDQELWKSITANRKVFIQVDEGLGSRWIQQFLENASNVHEIFLDSHVYEDVEASSSRIGRFSSLTALTHWSDLKQMTLYDMILDRDTLVGIFRAHRCTLEMIKLTCLGFHDGTWHKPIGCLTTMTELHSLVVSDMLEEHPYSEVQGPINAYTRDPAAMEEFLGPVLCVDSGTPLESTKEILNALINNFHTYKAYAVVHDSTKKFSHRVDLREAAAVANRTE
jgi:hypothetical protein